MEKILLIDGHSILNRAFYGVPPLTNHEGVHTNAVYGFINIMLKALEDEAADYAAVAFDLKAPTFRHKMYEEYKGTRKPMPAELHEQVPIIKEVLAAMEIPVITLEGYEADDILGTLAKKMQARGMSVSILSGDRDLLQLADSAIKIRMPKTSKGRTEIENYTPDDVKKKYGVTPSEFIDLKALMGDSSDNIPGVPGIGEKTASAIISKYRSIEAAYADVDNITPAKAKNSLSQNYDKAVLSKALATIEINAPVDLDVEKARLGELFTKAAFDIFTRLELKSLMGKFGDTSQMNDSGPEEGFAFINTCEEAREVFARCAQNGGAGVCVAAQGVELYGAALSTGSGYSRFIAVNEGLAPDFLTEQLSKLAGSVKFCAINLKPQVDFIAPQINDRTDDLALMAYLINPLKDSYLYDDIAAEYLGKSYPSRQTIAGKASFSQLAESAPDKLARICCYDACVAYTAYEAVNARLCEAGMRGIYDDIELPALYVLRSMEKEGIKVDRTALKEYGDRIAVKLASLEKQIYEEAGAEFNINSPKQLGEILFERMGLPSGKKTKTGYSTSAEVLEKLAPDYPVVSDVLEYRTLAKLKSTYADGLADYIGADCRIHGTFNQTITATGRISSTEPNLQNIPIRLELGRLIRKVFIPDTGYVFTDADYSQIELRLLAHMSADGALIEAYREDSDIHRITASKVFKTPLEEVTPRQRSNAKAVNFGIVYGISSFGLSRDLDISRQEAKEYIDEYFKTYPSIKTYLDKLVSDAKENGYSETLYGRRRPVPELSSGNFMQRQFGERIAMNSPLQGTAADIIKIAMINVYKRLRAENLRSRLILQIHDELLIETAIGEEEVVERILTEEMTNAADLRVPLEVDVHRGGDWYEAK